jgi:hypothetical protein
MSENEISTELKQPMELGEVFAKSGMFPDVKTQAQAVVKIMAGRELGLSAFQSMASIYIVNGRLALVAQAMSGLINKSKQYKYIVKSLTEDGCTIQIMKDDTEVGVSTFTNKDAAKAGLINKDNYKSYPRNMMFARALSNACRWYCPEVIQGYYCVEELQDLNEEIIPAKTTVAIDVNAEVKNGTEKA